MSEPMLTLTREQIEARKAILQSICERRYNHSPEAFELALCTMALASIAMREALKALYVQALQSSVNDASNEWGQEALEKARAELGELS